MEIERANKLRNGVYEASINNSKNNPKVWDLVTKNYNKIYKGSGKGLRRDKYDEIFQNTILMLSYKYDENKEFIEAFKKAFMQNKIAYERYENINNFLLSSIGEDAESIQC